MSCSRLEYWSPDIKHSKISPSGWRIILGISSNQVALRMDIDIVIDIKCKCINLN